MYIEPSQGRIVEVVIPPKVPARRFARAEGFDGEAVMVGIIAYVHNPELVNLAVIDHSGRSHDMLSMVLQQPDREAPSRKIFCRWPRHTLEHSPYRVRTSDPVKAPEAASGASEVVSDGTGTDRPHTATAGVPGTQGA